MSIVPRLGSPALESDSVKENKKETMTEALLIVGFTLFSLLKLTEKQTTFMTQASAGSREWMTVVSDKNSNKWLCLSCLFQSQGGNEMTSNYHLNCCFILYQSELFILVTLRPLG